MFSQEDDKSSAIDTDEFQTKGKLDYDKLRVKVPPVPRYLIRVHANESQGAMTETAFISAREFASHKILQLDKTSPKWFGMDLRRHLNNYKGDENEVFRSPWVSLTVSLRLALSWARLRHLRGDSNVRIAVLDTTTIGTDNCGCGRSSCTDRFHFNPIWPANLISRIINGYGDRAEEFAEEYVAFGHLGGKFKVCTFSELQTPELAQYLPELQKVKRNHPYTKLPRLLEELWKIEHRLAEHDQATVIKIAQQLSNDELPIPMIAFVLCLRRRSIKDRGLFHTIVKGARFVEKKHLYQFLGFYFGIPVFDFFSGNLSQSIIHGGSIELLQTSAILDRVRVFFAEAQDLEIRRMFQCSDVALLCKQHCPKVVSTIIEDISMGGTPRSNAALYRSFKRMQSAVHRSRLGALSILQDELHKSRTMFSTHADPLEPVHICQASLLDLWSREFSVIANIIESTSSSTVKLNNIGAPETLNVYAGPANGSGSFDNLSTGNSVF